LWSLEDTIGKNGRPVLIEAGDAALALVLAAGRQAKELDQLTTNSRRRRHGKPTLWALGRVADLLAESGCSTALPDPKLVYRIAEGFPYPYFHMSQWFLRVAGNRVLIVPSVGGLEAVLEEIDSLQKSVAAFARHLGRARKRRRN
jgi:hypothetical protein